MLSEIGATIERTNIEFSRRLRGGALESPSFRAKLFQLTTEEIFQYIQIMSLVKSNCSVCQVKKARTRTFRSTGPVTDARGFNDEVFLDFLKVSSGQEELRGVVEWWTATAGMRKCILLVALEVFIQSRAGSASALEQRVWQSEDRSSRES
jgi:hypothetical protein